MLYVSRKLNGNKYGVVDTDDDTETIVTERELLVYCGSLNMKIKGVALKRFANSISIHSISIIQDPSRASLYQAKAKALLGVDIVIRKDEIVSILVNYEMAAEDTVIRLSDYAHYLSGAAPIGWKPAHMFKSLRLIFDDKLEVVGDITSIEPLGVCYDIREFSDDAVVACMYKSLLKSNAVDYTMFADILLDRSDRHRFWVYVGIVNATGVDSRDDYLEGLKTVADRVEMSERVADFYKADFKEVGYSSVNLYIGREKVPGMLQDLFMSDWKLLRDCTDYKVLRESFIGVFAFLKYCSVLNNQKLSRFWNFVQFFDVPKWVQSLYVSLCHNTILAIDAYIGGAE